MTITDGTLDISKCYEDIEGQTIDISGGTIDIVSSGDGLSAAGGADQSGFGGRGPDSNGGNMGTPLPLPCRGVLTFCFLLSVFCYTIAAGVLPYTRVCTSVSIARSSQAVHAPPVVSRCSGIWLPPGVSVGWK